jgi:pimeloyl-ACP methyl ester carboxylesterase
MKRKRVVFVPSNAWTAKNLLMTTLLFVSVTAILPILSPSSVTASSATVPVYEITTRGVLLYAQGVNGNEYDNIHQLGDIKDLYNICYNETAIFVHGWGANETEAKERFDRVKMALEKNNYTYPLIGLSWDSDTEWLAAKFIAKWNGPKLADFITSLMNHCKEHQPEKDLKIRLIGHSIGARVILSTLDSLHKNPTWNEGDFKIASVHLMAAAVDDEEVSINPKDVLDDKTNWGSPKSDYGEAIQEEVMHFYNLYNPKDNVLEPNLNYSLQIYPSFEGDRALGQSGYQTLPNITLPTNYKEMNVQDEIVAMRDADGIEAEVFDLCNYNQTYCKIKSEGWDLGLCDLFAGNCHVDIGDNHAGYIGFRDPVNRNSLANDGAMNIVVSDWLSELP